MKYHTARLLEATILLPAATPTFALLLAVAADLTN
jgi:hypothetical protein